MSSLAVAAAPARSVHWSNLVLPKEHGSWSLAAEPLALGLLAVPSVAGGWLAIAALAGFLSRRPLKLALRESNPVRRRAARRALACCLAVALATFAAAVWEAGATLLAWTVIPAVAGGIFLVFDLQNEGRERVAEIAGASAFGSLAGAFAAAGGSPAWAAGALLFAMCARAIPTVMFVRAYVRAPKTGERRITAPLVAATAAVLIALLLVHAEALPAVAAVALLVLWLRTGLYLLVPGLRIRARSLGFQELALGLAYVVLVGLAWPR